MPVHARPRGVSDLRTLTGRSDTGIPAHKAYLRISFLELERARKLQEMRTARGRVDVIDARFREIDSEVADILANLHGTAPRARPIQRPHPAPVGMRRAGRKFKLSY
ncbi:hypothetical protein [Bradyrhizobium liaoningense]